MSTQRSGTGASQRTGAAYSADFDTRLQNRWCHQPSRHGSGDEKSGTLKGAVSLRRLWQRQARLLPVCRQNPANHGKRPPVVSLPLLPALTDWRRCHSQSQLSGLSNSDSSTSSPRCSRKAPLTTWACARCPTTTPPLSAQTVTGGLSSASRG